LARLDDAPDPIRGLLPCPPGARRKAPARSAQAPNAAANTDRSPNTYAGRTHPITSIPNLRDVGGIYASDGRRVRPGILYRSSALDRLSGADAAEFDRLGIRAIYDFRTEPERLARPDRVAHGTEYVPADVVGTQAEHTPLQIMSSMSDPAAAREAFRDGKGAAMFVNHYREFVSLDSARKAYGRVFRDLTDGRFRPALIHCAGGKDRTGWAAASLQLLLGVPEDQVLADFLASNEYLKPMFEPWFAEFEARGGDPGLIADFMWVRPEYLESVLGEMRRSYGTIERYFTDGLALDSDSIEVLRAVFLE
jgi:protein-tyrosine phosphatase